MSDYYWLNQACSTAAQLDLAYSKLDKFETFFEEIRKMTLNHDVIACTNGNRYASVNPKKLGVELAKIKEDWATPDDKATV